MTRSTVMRSTANVVFVPDDCRVIRFSELRELYELAGGIRPLAFALDVSIPTISRAMQRLDDGTAQSTADRVAKVKKRLAES